MSIFDNVEKAKEDLDFIGFGEYEVKVLALFAGKSKVDNKPYMQANVEVVTATPDSETKAGKRARIYLKEDKFQPDKTLAEWRSLGAAIMAEPFENVTGQILDGMTAPDQPATGNNFLVKVTPKPTKNPGARPFPQYRFAPVE